MTVFSFETVAGNIGSWQTYSCVITPEVRHAIEHQTTIGEELVKRYNPTFKMHFYLIAILMALAVIGIVHSFYKMYKTAEFNKRRPLMIQTSAAVSYIGLCIFACFTAFYRTGDINISALSSWLMSIFFIVFGVTAGSYAGGILSGKRPLLSKWIPAITASLTTAAMYVGELILTGGCLYKFGQGLFFEPLGFIPPAPIDVLVILASGGITYLLLWLLRDRAV